MNKSLQVARAALAAAVLIGTTALAAPVTETITFKWDDVSYTRNVLVYPAADPAKMKGLVIHAPGGCYGSDIEWMGEKLSALGWQVVMPIVNTPTILGGSPTNNPLLTANIIKQYLTEHALPERVVATGYSCGARALTLIQEHPAVDMVVALDNLSPAVEPKENSPSCSVWPTTTTAVPRAPAYGLASDGCQPHLSQWSCGARCKLLGADYWAQHGQLARVDVLKATGHGSFNSDAPGWIQDIIVEAINSWAFYDCQGPAAYLEHMRTVTDGLLSTVWTSGIGAAP